MKRTYLYITICRVPGKAPLFYYGSKTCKDTDKLNADGSVVGYFGSAPYIVRNKEYCQTRVFKWLDRASGQYTKEESELIQRGLLKHGAYYYGTCVNGVRRYHLDKFGRGQCLNCHWQTAAQISKEARIAGNRNQTSETRTKAAVKRWNSGCYDTEAFRTAARRRDNTHQVDRLLTEEAIRKAHEARDSESYNKGAKKVAATISGRIHFKCKPIRVSGIVTGVFNSIKEAEEKVNSCGIKITRATISQGLLRTNGNYNYKNKLNFSYV